MFAKYRTRSRFYKRGERTLRAYNVDPQFYRKLKVKKGLLNGTYINETVDLRDKERLEMVEAMRNPRERDFYQDHTYHNQWIRRDLEDHQRSLLASRYAYFMPNYTYSPWIWYPGDTVEVVSGEGTGQRGAIIAVVKYKNEIIVQNVNVQDVVIPASETRPEQTVQREHPINVSRVQHVDPSTNELCHLELVKVRNKETGELEEKRISLESGVLLPIPTTESSVEVGDPLKDTPIQDADEPTYDPETEMPLLVERRLRAMENYFVQTLKESHEYHEALRQRNAEDMLHFQHAVVSRASEKLAARVLSGEGDSGDHGRTGEADKHRTRDAEGPVSDSEAAAVATNAASTVGMSAWWHDMLSPYIESVQEEAQAEAEEARADAQRTADEARVAAQNINDGALEGFDEKETGMEGEEEEQDDEGEEDQDEDEEGDAVERNV